jgi:hypothetical protein
LVDANNLNPSVVRVLAKCVDAEVTPDRVSRPVVEWFGVVLTKTGVEANSWTRKKNSPACQKHLRG